MNCAYHGQNVAVVNCNGCGKPLCPLCDHRVKGFPFCQDCIVLGIELLRSQSRTNYSKVVKSHTSPAIAVILSFICPGLGAAYNGQTTKALIYFAVFVGLIQMAIISGIPFFVFGFLGMWLYTAMDAWKTAKLIRDGINPESAKNFVLERFSSNPKLWGIILTALGSAFLFQTIFDLKRFMRGVLPVLLIVFGIYLLRDFVLRTTNDNRKSENAETPVFSAAVNRPSLRTGFALERDFETETRDRAWKNRQKV